MWLSTPDIKSLRKAVAMMGLEFAAGERHFTYDTLTAKDVPARLPVCRGRILLSNHVVRLPEEFRKGLQKVPHDVGVFTFKDHPVVCVWDPTRGGYGLTGHVGDEGDQLWLHYAYAALDRVSNINHNWKMVGREVMSNRTLVLEFEDRGGKTGASIRVTVKADKTAVMAVNGGARPYVVDLTNRVSQRLGVRPDIQVEGR